MCRGAASQPGPPAQDARNTRLSRCHPCHRANPGVDRLPHAANKRHPCLCGASRVGCRRPCLRHRHPASRVQTIPDLQKPILPLDWASTARPGGNVVHFYVASPREGDTLRRLPDLSDVVGDFTSPSVQLLRSGIPLTAIPKFQMIACTDDRDVSFGSGSLQQFVRNQNTSLFVSFHAIRCRKIQVIECERLVSRNDFRCLLRDKFFVIPVGIEPGLPIESDDNEHCVTVTIGNNGSSNLRRDKQSILVVDGEFV